MSEDGVIKFQCSWKKELSVRRESIDALNMWREKLYQLRLIGEYPDGIGYGNISQRASDNSFWISGTQTGGIPHLTEHEYSLVTSFDLEKNQLCCEGAIQASSESLTHGALYENNLEIGSVFHVHNLELWEKLISMGLSTPGTVEYGTYEMAQAAKKRSHSEEKIFAMGGHKEGIITFGKNPDEAGSVLLKAYN